MSVRSLIGKEREDGTVWYVYCNNNGDLDGVGAILKDNYDINNIEGLLSSGDMLTLGESINKCVYYEDAKIMPLKSNVVSKIAFLNDKNLRGSECRYLFGLDGSLTYVKFKMYDTELYKIK